MKNLILISLIVVLISCQEKASESEITTENNATENSITLTAEQVKNTKIATQTLKTKSTTSTPIKPLRLQMVW